MAEETPAVLTEIDTSTLGVSYVRALGTNALDSQPTDPLHIGYQQTDRDIRIGRDDNTGTLELAAGPGGIDVSAASGDISIDTSASNTIEIGTGTTGTIEIGNSGAPITLAGDLHCNTGTFYLTPEDEIRV